MFQKEFRRLYREIQPESIMEMLENLPTIHPKEQKSRLIAIETRMREGNCSPEEREAIKNALKEMVQKIYSKIHSVDTEETPLSPEAEKQKNILKNLFQSFLTSKHPFQYDEFPFPNSIPQGAFDILFEVACERIPNFREYMEQLGREKNKVKAIEAGTLKIHTALKKLLLHSDETNDILNRIQAGIGRKFSAEEMQFFKEAITLPMSADKSIGSTSFPQIYASVRYKLKQAQGDTVYSDIIATQMAALPSLFAKRLLLIRLFDDGLITTEKVVNIMYRLKRKPEDFVTIAQHIVFPFASLPTYLSSVLNTGNTEAFIDSYRQQQEVVNNFISHAQKMGLFLIVKTAQEASAPIEASLRNQLNSERNPQRHRRAQAIFKALFSSNHQTSKAKAA